MRQAIDVVTRSLYVLSAGSYLFVGVVVLLLGSWLLPAWVTIESSRLATTTPSRCT
jgi:hypothetical protein